MNDQRDRARSTASPTRRRWLVSALVAAALLAAAVAAHLHSRDAPRATPATDPAPATITPADLLVTTGTFFEFEDHPLFLCVGAILESLPPQCGGAQLLVEGTTWADLGTGREAAGVRFTDQLEVTGTWDGSRFHVRSVAPAHHPDPSSDPPGPGIDGPGPDELAAAQQRIHDALGKDLVGSVTTGRASRAVLVVQPLFDTAEVRQRVTAAAGPKVAPHLVFEPAIRRA